MGRAVKKDALNKYEVECEVTTRFSRTIRARSMAEAKRMIAGLPAPANDTVLEEWDQSECWKVVEKIDSSVDARYVSPPLVKDDFISDFGDEDKEALLPLWLRSDDEEDYEAL